MKKYVLTFIWDENHDDVVLIEKNRPKWQEGLANGIGGSYEDSDRTVFHAATREIAEETGLIIGEKELYQFAEIVGKDYIVYCFTCSISTSRLSCLESKTDEEVFMVWWLNYATEVRSKFIPNLEFIVPLSKRKDYYTVFYTD